MVQFIHAVAPERRCQLIGIACDGASNMDGKHRGVVTRLTRQCTSDVHRVWCGAHQLDLVVKKSINKLWDETFKSITTDLTSHLRRQTNLVRQCGRVRCPSFVETRWVSMGSTLAWLVLNRPNEFVFETAVRRVVDYGGDDCGCDCQD
ncbi:TPA: hypothetical protein N0F65_012754 [Lagenidium giganteum]|uniref:Transposase n=1 Tax=Lagenidium giganteum TaxID=4803 RepID=A0AAV2YHI8_9STRA|nr:TPA: hypothetical protein N0F65_012754 [Lagenidium giganteum]